MKKIIFLFLLIPVFAFSQTKPESFRPKNDSVLSKAFKKEDTTRVIPIPNTKSSEKIKYFGLISKSKVNTVPIPNTFKPKDSLLARKNLPEDAFNIKK